VTALRLRDLLVDLAGSECEFVVIGSSALAIQGWDVVPTDLDLMTSREEITKIIDLLGVNESQARWVEDGQARRLECDTGLGPVDLYVAVSGEFSYDAVANEAVSVALGETGQQVKVGSLAHVRDMRAAVGRDVLPRGAVAPAAKTGTPRVIAIDGPAGAGKSTVSRAVAEELGFAYLDTGAMYRCVALSVAEKRADTDDPKVIAEIADAVDIRFVGEHVFLGERDVSTAIRATDITKVTAHIAAYPEVRQAMVARQRQMFSEGTFVAEGRDTGTVVAPDAPLKIFLTATSEERALRRSSETGEAFELVLTAIEERDQLDSARELSALRIAEDAVMIDTTGRLIEVVVQEIVELAHDRAIL
jgi:CMP/dCMP kinase